MKAHLWRAICSLALAAIFSHPVEGQSYTISTAVGAGLPSNVPGKSTSLDFSIPTNLTTDSGGNVYFADQDSVVRLDAATGLLTVVAGNGTPGYSGDNGPATSAQLNNPSGIAIDSLGNLYIADTLNYAIRKVSRGIITTIAGSGVEGTSCSNGSAASASFGYVSHVAIDNAGNIYVSDLLANCVRRITQGAITTVAGTGKPGSSGDGGPAVSAMLNSPVGIALDAAGNLFIADYGNGLVREVTAATGTIAIVAGDGSCCSLPGSSGPATQIALLPYGVAVDSAGNLYISSPLFCTVFEITNGVARTLAGYGGPGIGGPGYSGDNGPAASAQLNIPQDVAVDSAGNVYIADTRNSRIRKVSQGVITTVAGNGENGDNGPATGAHLHFAQYLALDSSDNLYLADSLAPSVRKVTAATGTITTVAGTGTNGISAIRSGSSANAVNLNQPYGVAVDGAGNVYVADPGFAQIFQISGGVISLVAGNGQYGYSGDNGPAVSAELWGALGITFDPAGNLYVADSPGLISGFSGPLIIDHIRKVSNGTITTVAGDGTRGSAGDGGLAIDAELNIPTDVAIDSAGDLFIADEDNNRIRMIGVKTGIITTVAGTGSLGFGGDGGSAKQALLNGPRGVALDSAGNIYIADTGNNRIRKVTASTGVITTIAGTGALGFSGDQGPATSAVLSQPIGIAVDSSGTVFFSDGGFFDPVSRVRILTPSTGSACAYSITPAAIELSAAGADRTLTVQTTAYCPWTIGNLPSWITVSGASAGTGPGSATFSLAGNTGAARGTTIFLGGTAVAVAQQGTVSAPPLTITLVANAEGEVPTIAANTWVEIKGSNLAPSGDSRIWQSSDFVNGQLPVQLDGVSVTVNGKAACVYYISPTQVNILTPRDELSGMVVVQVGNNGVNSPAFTVPGQAVSPSFFVIGGGPYVAATHADGSLIGPTTLYPGSSTPAQPGETIVVYGNGFGATSTPIAQGAVSQSGMLTPLPAITIGGIAATVVFAGLNVTPGEFQFNVVVPFSLGSGDQAIVAAFNGSTTQTGTLITVQQ